MIIFLRQEIDVPLCAPQKNERCRKNQNSKKVCFAPLLFFDVRCLKNNRFNRFLATKWENKAKKTSFFGCLWEKYHI